MSMVLLAGMRLTLLSEWFSVRVECADRLGGCRRLSCSDAASQVLIELMFGVSFGPKQA